MSSSCLPNLKEVAQQFLRYEFLKLIRFYFAPWPDELMSLQETSPVPTYFNEICTHMHLVKNS